MKPLHVLLRSAIDYAGLFPPAGLDMRSAVDNYATYLAGENSWALGRFVVPVDRLPEFEAAAETHYRFGVTGRPWQLAALAGSNLPTDLEAIAGFNGRHRSTSKSMVVVDTLEVKASALGVIEDTMHRIPEDLQVYVEIPVDPEPARLLDVIGGSRLRAKVRTGGVTPEAFPNSLNLIRFMRACIGANVPFKATAGLHHPLRAEYRLTYAADSARCSMFGFLNLFLAAAFLSAGMDERNALEVLEEKTPGAFQVERAEIRWRSNRLGLTDLLRARQDVIISFGSCSFTEPISELQALYLLQPEARQA